MAHTCYLNELPKPTLIVKPIRNIRLIFFYRKKTHFVLNCYLCGEMQGSDFWACKIRTHAPVHMYQMPCTLIPIIWRPRARANRSGLCCRWLTGPFPLMPTSKPSPASVSHWEAINPWGETRAEKTFVNCSPFLYWWGPLSSGLTHWCEFPPGEVGFPLQVTMGPSCLVWCDESQAQWTETQNWILFSSTV